MQRVISKEFILYLGNATNAEPDEKQKENREWS